MLGEPLGKNFVAFDSTARRTGVDERLLRPIR